MPAPPPAQMPSARGAADSPEMPHSGGQGFKEMWRWDFSWALVCEHQPWLGLAAVTPLSGESRWLPRDPTGQRTWHCRAEGLLGRCYEVVAIVCLPGNGSNGDWHCCDPTVCFCWLCPPMEHPVSMVSRADWGEEHGRAEKELGET